MERMLILGVLLAMALPALLPWIFVAVRVLRGWRRLAPPSRGLVASAVALAVLSVPMVAYLAGVSFEVYLGATCEGADCAGIGMLTFFISWPAYLCSLLACVLYWLVFRPAFRRLPAA